MTEAPPLKNDPLRPSEEMRLTEGHAGGTCSRKISYCAHATTGTDSGALRPDGDATECVYNRPEPRATLRAPARPCAAMRGHAQPCAACVIAGMDRHGVTTLWEYDLMRIRLKLRATRHSHCTKPRVTLRAFTMLRLHAPQRPLIGGLHTPTSCIPTGALHPCRGCQ